MVKEFWVRDIGAFVRLKEVKELTYEELEFEVLSDDIDHLLICPDDCDELYKGILDAKRIGQREGINSPEAVGAWQKLTPVEVIIAIKDMGRSGKFSSIYPVPQDIQFDI